MSKELKNKIIDIIINNVQNQVEEKKKLAEEAYNEYLFERKQIDQIVEQIIEDDHMHAEKYAQSKRDNFNAMLESFKLKEKKKEREKFLEDQEVQKMINWQKEQDERLRRAEEERAMVEEKKNMLYEKKKRRIRSTT